MVKSSGAGRVADRMTQLCAPFRDAMSLRQAVLVEIGKTVSFDAFAWLLTDPATEVGAAPLAEIPWVRELPTQIRLKYLTALNRWTQLGNPPAAGLRAAAGHRPERNFAWGEFLARHGVTDVASVVFRDRFGCWAFLELWRTETEDPFDAPDVEFLSVVAPPITDALRRCQAATFELTGPVPETSGPAVLVLSPELEVRAQTPETEALLRVLVPADADRRPIPAGAYNVGAQLLAFEAGVDKHPPSMRVHLSDGVWLTLRAARMGDEPAAGDIAVTIERTAPAERLDLFCRASGLTPRETELMGHLVAGAGTRQVAGAMFLSEHTVQDHLKAIFAKTSVPNRRSLLARVSGR